MRLFMVVVMVVMVMLVMVRFVVVWFGMTFVVNLGHVASITMGISFIFDMLKPSNTKSVFGKRPF